MQDRRSTGRLSQALHRTPQILQQRPVASQQYATSADPTCDFTQAWLDPLHLPTRKQLSCPVTGQAMQFLLQIYCPIDANADAAFHRSIFLFLSPRGDQLTTLGAVKALRCQLPRVNAFYSDQPASQSDLYPRTLEVRSQAHLWQKVTLLLMCSTCTRNTCKASKCVSMTKKGSPNQA